MLTTPAWIARPLLNSIDISRRNAAHALTVCQQRRQEREEVAEFLSGLSYSGQSGEQGSLAHP